MALVLILILIAIVILMICMAHFSHSGNTVKIIAMIALPFVGAIIGLLGDVGIASQSVGWFPVLWMYGGIIGFIISMIIGIVTAIQSSCKRLENSVVVFMPDGTEKLQKVTFIQGWKSFFRNAFNFKGRADLPLFGWGVLSYVIVNFALEWIIPIISFCFQNTRIWLTISALAFMAPMIPLVALNVRRLRDTGMKDGLNYTLNVVGVLAFIVPMIGMIYEIVLIVLLCRPTRELQRKGK